MTMDGQIRIEYMDIDEVEEAERNPKGHDMGGISDSIGRFGYIAPMLIDERDGKLVAGAGRIRTLRKGRLAGEGVPDRIIEREGRWYAPFIRGIKFKDKAEAEAYLLADNRLVELGGWDDEPVLAQMLSEIGDLKGTGFDGDDLDALIERLKPPNTDREKESDIEIEEAIDRWKVKEGDVFEIKSVNNHLIICGDAGDSNIFERIKSKAVISNIITSPPYAMQREGKYGGIPEDDYVKWFCGVAENIAILLDKDASFFLNIKAHSDMGERSMYVMELIRELVYQYGWRFIDEFCWLRNPPPGSWPNRFKNGFEPIYHLSKTTDIKFRPDNVKDKSKVGESYASSNINNQDWFNTAHEAFKWDGSLPSNVLDFKLNAPGTGHSAAFPIEVPEFFIKAFSDKDDIWLDPFVGSGTTILACELNGRSGIGIDKDPDMVAICLERLSKSLNTTPERSEGWLYG